MYKPFAADEVCSPRSSLLEMFALDVFVTDAACHQPPTSTSRFTPASSTTLLAPSTVDCQVKALFSLIGYQTDMKILKAEET